MADLAERLRSRIVAAREQISASQADLGSHLGLDNTAVSKIEQGKRSVSSLELAKIAEYCGKPLSWFFDDEPALVSNFRGLGQEDFHVRQDVRWLAEFADAYEFMATELAAKKSTV